MTVQNVIIDTDAATDVGDIGAITLLLVAHKLGMINILGFVIDTSASKVPGSVDACATWWGVSGLTYGAWKGAAIDSSNVAFTTDLYDNFPHSVGLASSVQDSTIAYRTMLAAVPDGSVDIITIGYLNALSAMRQSTADGISGLTGQQLIAAKVRRVWTMGGQYPSGTGEWNFRGGAAAVPAITAATDDIAQNLPVPWYLTGFETGTFVTGGTSGRASTDILFHAYTSAGFTSGRTAWDEQCALQCVQNGTDFIYTRGTNAINTTTGGNTFTAGSSGSHYYAAKGVTDAWLQARINALIGADKTASPVLSSWGSAPSLLQIRKS